MKPLSDFWKNRTSSDGYRWSCSSCERSWHKQYYDAHAEEKRRYSREKAKEYNGRWMEIIREKFGDPPSCQRCGYDKYFSILEFHHVDPLEKESSIYIWRKPTKRLLEELEKCILLCPNCHKEHHWEGIPV